MPSVDAGSARRLLVGTPPLSRPPGRGCAVVGLATPDMRGIRSSARTNEPYKGPEDKRGD
jgi:hypothetical protein